MIGPGYARTVSRGQATLTTPVSMTPLVADTFEECPGVWADGDAHDFTTSAAGLLTYSGSDGKAFLFNGVSDLEVAVADTVTYALYKNGVYVPTTETPHTFTAPAKTENISITAIVTLDNGDALRVWIKSLAGERIDIKTLRITAWGDV